MRTSRADPSAIAPEPVPCSRAAQTRTRPHTRMHIGVRGDCGRDNVRGEYANAYRHAWRMRECISAMRARTAHLQCRVPRPQRSCRYCLCCREWVSRTRGCRGVRRRAATGTPVHGRLQVRGPRGTRTRHVTRRSTRTRQGARVRTHDRRTGAHTRAPQQRQPRALTQEPASAAAPRQPRAPHTAAAAAAPPRTMSCLLEGAIT